MAQGRCLAYSPAALRLRVDVVAAFSTTGSIAFLMPQVMAPESGTAIPPEPAAPDGAEPVGRSLEVRLALTPDEIHAAQRLRYDVFYEEMEAKPSPEVAAEKRDFDRFDPICDHLLVFDKTGGKDSVVACYRLLRGEVAARHFGFYTADEYDIAPLLARQAQGERMLELGRSCVARAYRSAAAMSLLWRGLIPYLEQHRIDVMFGCASLPGTDPGQLSLPLAYLHHFHAMPEAERISAVAGRRVSMDLMPKAMINEKEAMRTLPPLVKGYIRTGALIGDGAVVDHEFGTTDVFIYFPVAKIDRRWLAFLIKKGAGEG